MIISIKNQIILALLVTDNESQLENISSLLKGMGIFRTSHDLIPDTQYMLLNSIFDILGQDKVLKDRNTLNDTLETLKMTFKGVE